MSASAQIKLGIGRIARGNELSGAAWTGNGFWEIVDDANDQSYENLIKGTDMTAIDTLLKSGVGWNNPTLQRWFTLHRTYLSSIGYSGFDAYFKALGYRCPYYAAIAIEQALGSFAKISNEWVMPKGVRTVSGTPVASGMHYFGNFTGTIFNIVDGAIDTTRMFGVPLVACNMQSDATNVVARCYQQAAPASYKDITVSMSGLHTYQIIGEQTITGVTATPTTGEIRLGVAATAQFTVGDWVIVYASDYSTAVPAKVKSISTNAYLELEQTTLPHEVVQNDHVAPMFTNVTRASGSISSNVVRVYALPDWAISL